MRHPLFRIGMPVLGLVLGLMVLAFWSSYVSQQKQPTVLNAGGSATGNALEFVELPAPQSKPAHDSAKSLEPLAVPPPSQTAILKDLSFSATEQVQRYLDSLSLSYLRVFQIQPNAIIQNAKPGIQGPPYPDISAIPGGVRSGDLLIYRKGSYGSRTHFPNRSSPAKDLAPPILMVWPHETIQIRKGILDTTGLRIIGFPDP